MPRKIPVKPYAPKPWDAGTAVEWDGRHGVVWSAGPVPASVWVAVDGDTSYMVPVKKPGPSRPAREITIEALPAGLTRSWLQTQRARRAAA